MPETLPEPRTGPARSFNPVDISLLRARLRGGMVTWSWFDPRRSNEEIARATGLSPSTVRRRFAVWHSTGFLQGFYVLPHPATFPIATECLMVEFREASSLQEALESLRLIDGIIMAYEQPQHLLVQVGARSEGSLDRVRLLISRMNGVLRVDRVPIYVPECSHRMTRLDWRIVQTLRRAPDRGPVGIAQDLGVSPRTAKLHYERMIEENVLAFQPNLGVNRFPGTMLMLGAMVEDPGKSEQTASLVSQRFENTIRVFGLGTAGPGEPSPTLLFLAASMSAAGLQDMSLAVRQYPGVSATFLQQILRFHHFPDWTDEQIREKLSDGGRVRSP